MRLPFGIRWRGVVLVLAAAHGFWASDQLATATSKLVRKVNVLRRADLQSVRLAHRDLGTVLGPEILSEPNVRAVLLVGATRREEFFFLSYYLAPIPVLLGPRDIPVYGDRDLTPASLRVTHTEGELRIVDPHADPATPPVHTVGTSQGLRVRVDDSTLQFLRRERVDWLAALVGKQGYLARVSPPAGAVP
jgi:hypothetical protein